jgi:hypothetical protein
MVSRYLIKYYFEYFCVSLRMFLHEVNIYIVWQIDFPNVECFIQSAEHLNSTKRLALLRVRENSSCQNAIGWDSYFFLPSD